MHIKTALLILIKFSCMIVVPMHDKSTRYFNINASCET